MDLIELKYWRWTRPKERFLIWLAYRVPHELAARVAIRVIAHATTGKWSNQVVPDLKAMDALQRWDIPNGR